MPESTETVRVGRELDRSLRSQVLRNWAPIATLFFRLAPNGVSVSPHSLRSMSTSEVTVTESPEMLTVAETCLGVEFDRSPFPNKLPVADEVTHVEGVLIRGAHRITSAGMTTTSSDHTRGPDSTGALAGPPLVSFAGHAALGSIQQFTSELWPLLRTSGTRGGHFSTRSPSPCR
jgi:hypothetical protein